MLNPWMPAKKIPTGMGAGYSYTGTGRAPSESAAFSPCAFAVSAPPRTLASLAACEVQRWVHAHVSRQYQRTSRQALPPSGIIWPAGKRMPHIQHDRTGDGSLPGATWWCGSVMICFPLEVSVRTVVSAPVAGLLTGAVVRPSAGDGRSVAVPSALRSPRQSPIVMQPPVHQLSAIPR